MDDIEEFIYYDIDYLFSPDGWLSAKLHNRFSEGFEIWRDKKEFSWRGKKLLTKENKNNE